MAPRYSLIPGDFVDDPRPTLVHYRVIVALGRRTNRAGWCRISQTKLAGHLDFARQRINMAIADLVTWGYVEKRGQSQTHRAICEYRVLLDRPVSEEEVDDGVTPDATDDESHADNAEPAPDEGTCSLETTPDVFPTRDTHVSPRRDTRVTSQVTRGVTSHETPITTPSRTTPLSQRPPPSGWARGWDDATRQEVEQLAAEPPHAHVATAFIAMVRGTLNPPAHVDGPSFVRQLRSRLKRFGPEVLAAAAEAILASDRHRDLPAAPAIEAACSAAEARLGRPQAGSTGPSPGADPALVALSPELIARLSERIGQGEAAAWFSGLICERLDGGRLTVSLPTKLAAERVDQRFGEPLLAVVRERLGAVERVAITVRSQPARPRAA